MGSTEMQGELAYSLGRLGVTLKDLAGQDVSREAGAAAGGVVGAAVIGRQLIGRSLLVDCLDVFSHDDAKKVSAGKTLSIGAREGVGATRTSRSRGLCSCS